MVEKNKTKSIEKKIEKGGLDYVNKNKNYLILSAIFPIYLIIVQILNIVFILILEAQAPQKRLIRPSLVDIISPFIILLVIGGFALVMFRYLFSWKSSYAQYLQSIDIIADFDFSDPDKKLPNTRISLTSLFYRIMDNMNTLRILFIIINIISIYNFLWAFQFFFIRIPRPQPPPILHLIINWFNLISQIGLIIYLILQWKHFIRWNNKYIALKNLEREIYDEIFPVDG